MIFHLLAAFTALLAGVVAAISGFGIGSLLTPLLSMVYGTKSAVAIVSVPHVIATAIRFFYLRKNIDKRIFLRFGLASALGGLLGAVLHIFFTAKWLGLILGTLLILAGIMNSLKNTPRLKGSATLGGIASGLFGGLVGNQGGIRAAALINFSLSKEALVAVSTASALLVDGARMPVYLWFGWKQIISEWPLLLLLCTAVVAGTFTGMKLLKKINALWFKRTLSCLLIALGAFMLYQSV